MNFLKVERMNLKNRWRLVLMKEELVRINSIDGIEIVGILYEQKEKQYNSNSCLWIMVAIK